MAKKVVKGKAFNVAPGIVYFKGKNPNKIDDIDIGPNNSNGLSVNNGEFGKGLIASADGKKVTPISNNIRILSNEPMFNGKSPAQLLYGGMPFDTLFAMQEQYKKTNRIADDGSKYKKGGKIDYDDIANKYIAEYNAGKYTTKLSDEDENKFKTWYNNIPVKMYNQSSNADDFEHGYDWRGYWLNEWKKDGGKKEWNKMSSSTKEKWHWPDTYKQPHHHTFSNESKYSTESQNGGVWKDNNFNPSEYNYLLEYALADKNSKKIIDRRKNKQFNYDDFVRFAKSHKQFNLTDDELKDIWSGFTSTKINPAALSYLVSSESKFDKNAKAGFTSAKGLYQITDVALKQLYGDKQGEIISKQYKDNKRSVKDQTFDLIKYIDKYNSSDTTYGLLKSKHLVPNVSETSIIPSVVWNGNITPSQKKLLVQNKSTMKDFINILNNEYDNSMFSYNRNFKFGGKTNIDSLEKKSNTKFGDWFRNATLKAAMADAPAVMQASGWDYDKNGNLQQGDPNAEGPTKLRNNLAEIAMMPATDMLSGLVGSAIVGSKFYKNLSSLLKSRLQMKALDKAELTALRNGDTIINTNDGDITSLSYFFERPGTQYKSITRHGRTVKAIPTKKNIYNGIEKVTPTNVEDAIYIMNNYIQASQSPISGFKSNADVIQQIAKDSKRLRPKHKISLIEDFALSKDSYPLYQQVLLRNQANNVGHINVVKDNGIIRMMKLNNYGTNPKSFSRIDKGINQLKTVLNDDSIPDRVTLFGNTYVPAIEFYKYKYGGIHIKPSKQGTFTAAAKKHGIGVQTFASKVLANKENYSPAMVKKANFARNAKKWHHLYGGEDTLINSLGERPNAKHRKEMKNKRNKAVYGLNQPFYPTYVDGPLTGLRIPQNTLNMPAFPTDFTPKSTIGQIDPFMVIKPSSTILKNTSTSNGIADTHRFSGLSALEADLIGSGINAVGSLIAAGINQGAINNQKFTPRRAVLLNPVKLKTKININPQLSKLREMQAQIADAARRTSGSSREAYRRILAGYNRTLESAMDLYGRKENTETELINRDKINQQGIANQNATNVINTLNTNITGKDALNNNWHMLTAQNWINPVNVIAGTVAGERGILARRDARRNNAANLAMMSLAYPDAASMIMNGDYWQKAFNGYYDILNNKIRV